MRQHFATRLAWGHHFHWDHYQARRSSGNRIRALRKLLSAPPAASVSGEFLVRNNDGRTCDAWSLW